MPFTIPYFLWGNLMMGDRKGWSKVCFKVFCFFSRGLRSLTTDGWWSYSYLSLNPLIIDSTARNQDLLLAIEPKIFLKNYKYFHHIIVTIWSLLFQSFTFIYFYHRYLDDFIFPFSICFVFYLFVIKTLAWIYWG